MGLIQQAQDADDRRSHNKAIGPLHGIPVGVKDIIDTAQIPTERGTSIYKGANAHGTRSCH